MNAYIIYYYYLATPLGMCNLSSPTEFKSVPPAVEAKSWPLGHQEVLHGLPTLVSPFTGLILRHAGGPQTWTASRGDWSNVSGNAVRLHVPPAPAVLLLQGGWGSSHIVGLSELKSTESYPGVKHGLKVCSPLHLSVALSLDQPRKGAA